MLSKDSATYQRVAQTIDDFMSLDLTGVGSIRHIRDAVQRRQPGFNCMGAAEVIATRLRDQPGPVLIITGFPEGGGVPETDGPVGAALLARALFLGFGVHSIIAIDHDWDAMMRATCMGAGLSPRNLPADGQAVGIDFLRPVYIRSLEKDDTRCHAAAHELIETSRPALVISIERPGANANGLYHGLGGRPLDGMVGDADYLFNLAKQHGIPTIGIGDGGNELGMGVIAQDLPTFSPKARDCGIPGRGGVAAANAADHLVISNVSNWGATGLIAALTALLENPTVFHDAELERRSIELCVGNGGVDGMFMAPEPAVDGIHVDEWVGLVHTLRATVLRTLGHTINWKGDQGDWRQIK
ncbi:DUF4392 domain-containing protein [Corticimicrobacter populi]|uniref:D-glutamate cyclase-like C-terminal domain-containing protein n=1 Tax=Corticimicrobacter populi TaxID=2175229 RepID=A0A2V1K4S5_9BURK|nr:glutamate cyclase domain-containing protein [Corticimicrobacter populi]PWF24639.1 hypothetical protein DD235_00080 [Corticimicrobacter populi]